MLRIIAALIIGGAFRCCRRLLGLRPRIWHGFWVLLPTLAHVRMDRRRGFPTRCVAHRLSHFGYPVVSRSDVDVVLEDRGVAHKDLHWHALADLLVHGDIWVTFFDSLFYPGRPLLDRAAFRLLRLAGVRIVALTQGGDVVHRVPGRTRYDWVGRWQASYPSWDLRGHAPLAQQRIRHFSRFADLVCVDGAYTQRFLPRWDLLFKPWAVDTEALQPCRHRSARKPLIVHAPNHRPVKGTESLLAACAELERRGFEFELKIVERTPPKEAAAVFREADIIADQFCMGSYGYFALQGLALGKPVLVYSDQEELGNPRFNLPVVNANADNLGAVLAPLLVIPELRGRLGQAGRAAVEKYHSIEALSDVWSRIYLYLWRGQSLRLEETATFSPSRQARSFTEDPTLPEFWPIETGDLLGEMHAAQARARGRGDGGRAASIEAAASR